MGVSRHSLSLVRVYRQTTQAPPTVACIGSIPLGDFCLSPRPLDFQVEGLRVSDVFQVGVLYISPAHPNSICCFSSGCCLVLHQFGAGLVRLSSLRSPSSVWEILGLSRSSRATAFLGTASTRSRGLVADAAGTNQPIGTTRKPCASPPTRSTGGTTVATLWLWVPIPMQRTSAQACQRGCLTKSTSLWGGSFRTASRSSRQRISTCRGESQTTGGAKK